MKITLIISVVVLVFWASKMVQDNDLAHNIIKELGYFGVFIVAVVSGFNLVVPIPAVSFLPIFISAGLNALITIAVIAAGMTLADSLAYLLGKTGRGLVLSSFEKRVSDNFRKFQVKLHWSPTLVLFLFASFAPFPNEVLVVPLSFLGYGMRRILIPVFLGNVVFVSIYSIGVINLLKIL